jgi:hypothetical protein
MLASCRRKWRGFLLSHSARVLAFSLFLHQAGMASSPETDEMQAAHFDHSVQVSTQQDGNRIFVNASFRIPQPACEAYAFMTDYEKNLKAEPEIVEASVSRLAEDQVLIKRRIREFVLFFPIHVNMVVKYTERPGQGLNFQNAGGDMKEYFGTWRVEQEIGHSVVRYDARINLDSLVPDFILQHLIAMRLQDKFQRLAIRASQQSYTHSAFCLASAGPSGL